MTFVASLISRRSIWMVADRRLTFGDGRVVDDAIKIFSLETPDGRALVGYAGLGQTARGTQPSQWMSDTLRGRNWPMNSSMKAVSDAMVREMPRHLLKISGERQHVMVAPAFVGKRPRAYGTMMRLDPRDASVQHQHVLLVRDSKTNWPFRFIFAGSGSDHISKSDRRRDLLRLANAFDAGKINAFAVADMLASLSFSAHEKDSFTGPKSLVVWRSALKSKTKSGGGFQFYDGVSRDHTGCGIPSISNGIDMAALGAILMRHSMPKLEAMLRSVPVPPDPFDLNDALSRLPDTPDDKLR